MVKREEGEQLAKEYSVNFMETSAKSGFNVEIAFMAVARYRNFYAEVNCKSLHVNRSIFF